MLDKTLYQHPKDGSLLRSVLEADQVEKLFDWCREKQLDSVLLYAYRSSCLEITEKSIPDVYRMILEACALFGVETPICFLIHDFDNKIQFTGIFTPILLISDTYIEQADERTLFASICSQVASIALGHQTGIGLIWIIENCTSVLPIPPIVLKPVEAMLNQWKRCRWFSCDRAAFLAVNDYGLALHTLFDWTLPTQYLKNFSFGRETDAYEEQATVFTESSKTERLIKLLNSMQNDTPWLPERYRELKDFQLSLQMQSKESDDE